MLPIACVPPCVKARLEEETFGFAAPHLLPIVRAVSAASRQTSQPISASTRLCAVFGHPIRHSASPAMHNAAIAELGLDWRYLAFDVKPEHLSAALEGARVGLVDVA